MPADITAREAFILTVSGTMNKDRLEYFAKTSLLSFAKWFPFMRRRGYAVLVVLLSAKATAYDANHFCLLNSNPRLSKNDQVDCKIG